MPQRLLRKASHAISPGALAAPRSASSSASETASEGLSHHVTWRLGRTLCFYDLPKLLFGTLKCLEPLAAPPAMPHRLLRKASHAISPGALATHSVFMTFRNCFLAPSLAAPPAGPRDCFGRPLAISPGALPAHSVFMTFQNCFLAPSNPWNPSQRPQRLLRKVSHAMSPGALAAHSVFMTFRNCFLAPSNAWNPSQRLQQCLRVPRLNP